MEQSTEPLTVGDALKENEAVFEGHPAGTPVEDKTPGEGLPPKGNKPLEGGEASPDGSGVKFKYASQEAAEAAYKEAESLIGKSTAETKRERERAEALQTELSELRSKAPVVPPKAPEPPKQTNADRMKELLDKVNQLDPEDEDYQTKVAEVWGQREDAIQDTVDAKVKEALDVYAKKVQADKEKADAEINTQKSILSDATTAGENAGLDMKKGSNDSELFWAFADKAPEGSIEEQIKWTVDKVSGIKTTLAAP
ncbi:MAG: hypothetical protein U9N82_07325, partial [Thermodesulfobacteriota bacterium]|nr:hypothetical protein [Thermodesulfobacteriota bacterium]